MRILLIGSTGFIGRHITSHLILAGHEVLAAVRDTEAARRRFPDAEVVGCDLNKMTHPSLWRPLLARNIDAVVNCAGILQSGPGQSARAIHTEAPKALFDACLDMGVRRVVHISAVSADAEAGTEYADTKKAADDYLRGLELDWVVLRPSLIYAKGSFGGSSVLRGLAGLPFVTPVLGNGRQVFQPLHVEDLAETVLRCLVRPELARQTLEPVGPESLTVEQILGKTRRWLDFAPASVLRVPMSLCRLAARFGDALGAGPIRSTSLRQMEYGNTSRRTDFPEAVGLSPRSMDQALLAEPSHVQDRWHARLYFLAPLLTLALGLLWVGSGLAGLMNPPADAVDIATAIGFSGAGAAAAPFLFCVVDLLIGFCLLSGKASRLMGWVQLIMVGGYTAGLGLVAPGLWLDPYGALLKNLPILALILTWMALQDDK